MRHMRVLFTLSILVIAGCCPSKGIFGIEESRFHGYIPIDPIPVIKVTVYDPDSLSYVEKYWATFNSLERLRMLPNQTAEVSVKNVDSHGKVKFFGSSASGSKGIYEVIMDYMKYYIDTVLDDTGFLLGSRKIGVGLRMTAKVQTSKANINIGGLSALAAQAVLQNLSGSISVNVIGIDSRDITNLIPITSQLDQTSIQSALQALAAVKAKLWDSGQTTLTPHILAVQQRRNNSVDRIIQSKSYVFEDSKLGSCIEAWWKPKGQVDTKKTELLNSWLKVEENIALGAPEDIANLISGGGLEKVRAKVIKDIDIPCGNKLN